MLVPDELSKVTPHLPCGPRLPPLLRPGYAHEILLAVADDALEGGEGVKVQVEVVSVLAGAEGQREAVGGEQHVGQVRQVQLGGKAGKKGEGIMKGHCKIL